jgi:SAM-dependent methyltransferase
MTAKSGGTGSAETRSDLLFCTIDGASSPGHVHPVAAGGFASAAPTYARIRPAYARAVIGAIKEHTASGGRVLDVAAGTGILSGQLRRAGLAVVAVEPVEEMLVQLMRTLPEVPALRGVAERLPFASGSVATVAVGEAFDWFDASVALAEARRVLCAGGLLALAWNRRDDSVDWVARYAEAVVSELPDGRPYDRLDTLEDMVRAAGGFGPAEVLRVPNPRPSGPRQLVDRAASTSFVADADPEARGRVLDRVRELATSHPDLVGRDSFDLPYVTELWTWRAD